MEESILALMKVSIFMVLVVSAIFIAIGVINFRKSTDEDERLLLLIQEGEVYNQKKIIANTIVSAWVFIACVAFLILA